ncbi:Serine protease easter [Frankliniella fusca]|uniref:limulus clotting factor C n=1 Tax=Frankliniella fusca TaxID=407009 RepID=A0AAE1GUF5_9NEOP|nr:Serine protease easter [Frankliniella fusca]
MPAMRNPLCAALLLATACASLTLGERACLQHEACVVLSQCPELQRLVSNRRPSSTEQERLRAAHCGFQGNKAKIINGDETVVMEFPWAVRLGYRFGRGVSYQCGGALISSRYVLTAAHCTDPKKPPVTVRLGEHDTRTDEDCSMLNGVKVCAPPVQDVRVEEVLPHPEFVRQTNKRDGLWNDIALLRLARPVTFSNAIQPVCLPNNLPPNDSQRQKTEMVQYVFTVVGWGRIGKEDDADTSDVLLKLILRTMKHSECAEKYKAYQNKLNEERQMCGIAKQGKDVCKGDSGGPLSSFMTLANGKDKGPIRGNGTYVMEIPWIARLGYTGRSGIEYQCSGTLISSRYVLTAASCTSRPPVTVRLGERDLNSDPDCQLLSPDDLLCAPPVVDVAVEEVAVHPGAPLDDVALLRLVRRVAVSAGVRPICLPVHVHQEAGQQGQHQDQQDTRLLWAEMVGWGSIGDETVALAQWPRPTSSSQYAQGDRPCDAGAVCKPLKDCPALSGLAQRGKRPSKEEVQTLQSAHCGFMSIHPKVCCPTSPGPRPRPGPGGAGAAGPGMTSAALSNLQLLPLSQCGPVLADRIIGGREAQVNELPWMARLGYRRDEYSTRLDYSCGGSLISNRYVLTAAHCINEQTGLVPVSVRLGEKDARTPIDCEKHSGEEVCALPPVDVDVERVIKHKDYGQNRFQNDIALLRLAETVSFTDSVKPVCLPVEGDERRRDLTGKKVQVAGWGRVANRNGATTSETLMKVAVPVTPAEDCIVAYQPLQLVISPDRQMCAGDKGKDSCNGDSGGPLTSAGYIGGTPRVIQHGVVSFGPSHCATEGTPGVYTRLTHYVPWIVSNLEP